MAATSEAEEMNDEPEHEATGPGLDGHRAAGQALLSALLGTEEIPVVFDVKRALCEDCSVRCSRFSR